jgi:hypothetical protein
MEATKGSSSRAETVEMGCEEVLGWDDEGPEMNPSRMFIETEETVKMVEGVLVKTTEVGLGDSDSVITIVDDGTCNKGEQMVGGRDGDDTEKIAVSVREGDKEEEEITDGNSLEQLLVIILSWLST